MPLIISRDIGLESSCLMHFRDSTSVISRLQLLGVRNIELCYCHIDYVDADQFERDTQPYRDAGISILSLFHEPIEDEKAGRLLCECAKRAGVRHLATSFSPDSSPASWQIAERLGDEFDLMFAIHNRGGSDWLGSRQMLAHVLKRTSRRIGVCLDTGWALATGENPLRFIEKLGERIYGVHIKDFIFDRAGKPQDVVPGTGNLDLSRLIPALEQLPHLQFAVLDCEGQPDDPMDFLRVRIDAIRLR